MIEVEIKFACSDWAKAQKLLDDWHASPLPMRTETDRYFNAPDRDFAKTDEALRIRQIGEQNFFTYKGPKMDSATKSRKEIEFPIAEGAAHAQTAGEFLLSLGYRSVATVKKSRRIFQFERQGFHVEVCFDEVQSVGKFVEVEIQAQPAEFETAKSVLMRIASDLGLHNQEKRSYLQMLLLSRQ